VSIRNRYGKVSAPISSKSVIGRLQACMSAVNIVPFIQKLSVDVTYELDQSLIPAPTYQKNEGSKILFLAVSGALAGNIVLIREPGKRLDFVGGVIEEGETPLDACVREVFEELQTTMVHDDFIPLGITKDQTDTMIWISHVFLAVAPQSVLEHPNVELHKLPMGRFDKFKNSDAGRPRVVWLARHLDFLSERFGDLRQAQMCWHMYRPEKGVYTGVVPNHFVIEKVGTGYFDWFRRQLSNPVFAQECKMGRYWVPPELSELVIASCKSVANAEGATFPSQVKDSIVLLSSIFMTAGGKREISAQVYYKTTHQMGGPPGRNLAMKWIEGLSSQSYIDILPQVDGNGRRFYLTDKALAEIRIYVKSKQTVTIWGQVWYASIID
jgi:8-oxo-dGTP pyrophosphatase MutT (NUDIX family)